MQGSPRSLSGPRRRRATTSILVIGTLLASIAGYVQTAAGASFTFTPPPIRTSSSAARTTNYGSATTLKFGASPSQHAYLLFNVTGTGSITNATLRVWAIAAGTGASVHATSTAWSESGLTYTNAPAYGATLSTVSGFAAGVADLQRHLAGRVHGAVAFMYTSTPARRSRSAAREGLAHAPQLVVHGERWWSHGTGCTDRCQCGVEQAARPGDRRVERRRPVTAAAPSPATR